MSLRESLRKFPWIHKPISLFFQCFIYPVCNGYYLFMIKYLLTIRKNEIKALRTYDFINVKPFKTRVWRNGSEKDCAYRRYYLADYHDSKCFIKVAQNDSTISNEIFVAEQLQGKEPTFISKIITFDRFFTGSKQMLATGFVNGLHPISKESVYNNVESVSANKLVKYCKQMLEILGSLETLQLVHADIHKGNLMLDANDNLVLLDFGISKFLNKENDVQYRFRPGTFFREKNGLRIYDDAFSFVKLINRYESCKNIIDDDAYKAICARINKVTFSVKI